VAAAAAAYLILFADTFKTIVGEGEMWRNNEFHLDKDMYLHGGTP